MTHIIRISALGYYQRRGYLYRRVPRDQATRLSHADAIRVADQILGTVEAA